MSTELPNNSSSTHSSADTHVSFSMNVPVYNRLSGNLLEKNGWNRVGNEYHKDGMVLKYDGVHFKIDGRNVEWLEEISE